MHPHGPTFLYFTLLFMNNMNLFFTVYLTLVMVVSYANSAIHLFKLRKTNLGNVCMLGHLMRPKFVTLKKDVITKALIRNLN